MKKIIFQLLLIGICYNFSVSPLQAQSTITFQVNLKPQLKDSVFIPGRDAVTLTGNIYPITNGEITLKDEAPRDSIYTVEVKFPGSYTGKKLEYNFVLETEQQTIKESMPRQLGIRSGTFTLDALYFDSFAW